MSDYTINFKRSEPTPMWSYPISLAEYEAEIEKLKARIAELEADAAKAWKIANELAELILKTDDLS